MKLETIAWFWYRKALMLFQILSFAEGLFLSQHVVVSINHISVALYFWFRIEKWVNNKRISVNVLWREQTIRLPSSRPTSIKWLVPFGKFCVQQFYTQTFVFNPFVPKAPFLYPLKACFQGIEKGFIGNEWVKQYSGRYSK